MAFYAEHEWAERWQWCAAGLWDRARDEAGELLTWVLLYGKAQSELGWLGPAADRAAADLAVLRTQRTEKRASWDALNAEIGADTEQWRAMQGHDKARAEGAIRQKAARLKALGVELHTLDGRIEGQYTKAATLRAAVERTAVSVAWPRSPAVRTAMPGWVDWSRVISRGTFKPIIGI